MQISSQYDWMNLTPEPGHFAFGYYDRCPWDSTQELHLALQIPQQDHLPEPGELAGVGVVERRTRRFHKLADTRAWCHQQGAMTLWLKHQPRTFVYNDFVKDGDCWRPIARIHNLDRGETGHLDVPIYTISGDGRWGLTLNFSRIPRRGYSYALAPLPRDDPNPDLDGDGLFLVDMQSSSTRLIASYRQMIACHPYPYDLAATDPGAYMWLNHAIFNSDSSRAMVLFRTAPQMVPPVPWRTHMMTMALDGSDLRCSLSDIYWRHGAISHQIWGRTPGEILVDADWCGRGHEYVVFDESHHPFQAHRISPGMGPAGHLNFSPDGRRMVADTYPNEDGVQRLALVDVASGEITELGRFLHRTPGATGDVRCDLHPRWSADGRLLTVDTIHEGERKVFMLVIGD
ncbi:MAG: hypothetical protein JXC32_04015 [Anaerolineae bacterium]|nr:hypothetical protein [Anaerolineae bacterium]